MYKVFKYSFSLPDSNSVGVTYSPSLSGNCKISNFIELLWSMCSFSAVQYFQCHRFFSSRPVPRQVIDNIVLAAATSPRYFFFHLGTFCFFFAPLEVLFAFTFCHFFSQWGPHGAVDLCGCGGCRGEGEGAWDRGGGGGEELQPEDGQVSGEQVKSDYPTDLIEGWGNLTLSK